MKICIIGSRGYPYVYSGYETLVKELSERLVSNDISVTVYCHKNLFHEYPKKINKVNLVYLSTIETKSLSQLTHSFISTIHACFSSFDLILYLNVANGPFGIITTIFRKPTAINVDGLEWLRPKWKGLGAKYFKLAAKLSTLFIDEIITDSFEMQNVYLKEFNKNSEVIAYGPNKLYSKGSDILNRFNLKSRDFFLIIGRLIPDNNADFILEEYLNTNTNKKLVVVGDVPYKDVYADKLKKINNSKIVFTGYVNNEMELCDLYKNCFGYIHGHEFGGTNPTMINALNYHCYIIALDTKFNREMLDNGKYGFFFKKEKNSIKNLINYNNVSKINFFRKNSYRGIDSKYDWNAITKKYIEVFKNLVDK